MLKNNAGNCQALGPDDIVRVLDGIRVDSDTDALINLMYDSNPKYIRSMKPLVAVRNAIGFSDTDSLPATDAFVNLTNWLSLVCSDADNHVYELAAHPSDGAVMFRDRATGFVLI